MLKNTRVILSKRPVDDATPDCFSVETVEDEALEPGQVRVAVEYISVDAGTRTMLRGEGFHAQVGLGETIRAGGVGRIIESSVDGWDEGQAVRGGLGAQTIATVTPEMLEKVDDNVDSLSAYLGALGASTGVTSWIGIRKVAKPQPGDIFVVSAAAGAVGSIAGQIAKRDGAFVIGIAGGQRKVTYLTERLGFDAAIDYGATGDLSAAIAEQFPDGLDVYFDNVGGEMLEAAIDNLALHARIAICGMISEYNQSDAPGPRNMWNLLVKRARIEGFLVSDFRPRYQEARAAIDSWIKEGRLKYKLDEREGFDILPRTLNCLFDGDHDGRLLVKLVKEVDTVI